MRLLLLLLAAHTLVDAMRQGVLVWILREDVPSKRGEWLDASLHTGGLLLYGVAGLGLWWLGAPHTGLAAAALLAGAALVRAVLFDPTLALTRNYYNHREGRPAEPLFSVGTTARTDQALRWLAPRLRLRPEPLRAAIWGLSVAAGALGFFLL